MAIRRARIQGYKALDDVSLDDIPRFSLLTGVNDIGKTSVLEALALRWTRPWQPPRPRLWEEILGLGELRVTEDIVLGSSSETQALRVARPPRDRKGLLDFAREFQMGEPEAGLAEGGGVFMDDGGTTSTWDGSGNIRGGSMALAPLSPMMVEPIGGRRDDVLVTEVSLAIQTGREEALVALLASVNPAVDSIRILVPQGRPVVGLGVSGKPPRPLDTFGWGTRATTSLGLSLFAAAGGTIVVDEFAVGIHVSALRVFVKTIAEIADREDVQLIATSHSAEVLRSWAETVNEDDIAVYRLAAYDGKVAAHRVGGDSVVFSAEHGLDMR